MWGTTERLLINKNILKEPKSLDYKKPLIQSHEWLLRSSKLAKIPLQLLSAIENLTKHWATIASLHGTNESVITDIIKYRNGLFQGDTLSVLLFLLSRNHTLMHNFFVDGIKLYASSISILKKQLDLVTTFSNDIGMKFGQDKCAYIKIEKEKNTTTTPIEINGLTIKPIQEGKSYRYLGQDENVAYEGTINKEKVSKEYPSRVKKLWSSELSAFYKTIAHNAFATPVITLMIGILDWTIQEIKDTDIRTRKNV